MVSIQSKQRRFAPLRRELPTVLLPWERRNDALASVLLFVSAGISLIALWLPWRRTSEWEFFQGLRFWLLLLGFILICVAATVG